MNHSLVWAYLDPGTGSMLLQAIVGGSAGLFVFLRHVLRSLKPATGSSPAPERIQSGG